VKDFLDFSYFPGCSLATTAAESNLSLIESARILGFNLIELEDWNCCGSAAAKSVSQELPIALAARNLSLSPADRPLVVMCPRCLHQLRYTQACLKRDPQTRRDLEAYWGRTIPLELEIVHFLEVLVHYGLDRLKEKAVRSLQGLRYVPYYGCTLYRPPALIRKRYFQGEMENVLAALGAQAVPGAFMHRCCGSFLSATRPDIVTPLVNEIVDSAVAVEAHCVVTACAMCQLNLEIRCTSQVKLPVFHFSEILALALGARDYEGWFSRHLVDPRPLLQGLDLVA
jgi:heterodisulfide reductase subunit B